MIDEIGSIADVWRKMPSEHHARVFLEGLVWPEERFCPHCGSVHSVRLRGESVRPGLYQCRERECRRQFTVTTRTPLHGTKLDLRVWVCAMMLMLTSSKGLSSVVMARLLDVNQKIAWKMGHAIRELMDDRHGEYPRLQGEVEADEGYLGGAPKSLAGAAAPRGRGTTRPMVLVAADRDGRARAAVVPDGAGATLGAKIAEWVDPAAAWLMTDGNSSYNATGQQMAGHSKVVHSQGQYADPLIGAHVNTAEAVIVTLRRALIGAYHTLSAPHLQRYVDEVVWRWNHREPAGEKTVQRIGRSDRIRTTTTTIWKPVPVVEQMRAPLQGALGRQVRRSACYGLRWP
jgi:transposase-like protein